MKVNPGDTVFHRDGRVATVRGFNEERAELQLESRNDLGKDELRHGYLNGLTVTERQHFNQVLDDIKKGKDTQERVVKMTEVIHNLRVDPKNHKIINYLESELNHLMRTENYQPRVYSMPENVTD